MTEAKATADDAPPPFRLVEIAARDGLRLAAREYGRREWSALPVVCLPGLARTAGDFDPLARHLAEGESARRVLCVDYRGRGASARDPDWRNYDVHVELDDLLSMLAATEIAEAVFIGTSRGGLLIMGLAALRPALLRGAVLNDVGPVIDAKGLVRIRSYVGKLPQPRNYHEGADILKTLANNQFPRLDNEAWERAARLTWVERSGRLAPAYDPALLKTLENLDLETPLPTIWPLFDALADVPLMAIRGANSDLLAPSTFEEMGRRHPTIEQLVVPDQGHAPLLAEPETLDAIARFVAKAEATPRALPGDWARAASAASAPASPDLPA